jgi:hypothetical protein
MVKAILNPSEKKFYMSLFRTNPKSKMATKWFNSHAKMLTAVDFDKLDNIESSFYVNRIIKRPLNSKAEQNWVKKHMYKLTNQNVQKLHSLHANANNLIQMIQKLEIRKKN